MTRHVDTMSTELRSLGHMPQAPIATLPRLIEHELSRCQHQGPERMGLTNAFGLPLRVGLMGWKAAPLLLLLIAASVSSCALTREEALSIFWYGDLSETPEPTDARTESVVRPLRSTEFPKAPTGALVRFSSEVVQERVVFIDRNGVFACWYDPEERVSRVTVHWYEEYEQGVVDDDDVPSASWSQSGYPETVTRPGRASAAAYTVSEHEPPYSPLHKGHLVEQAAFQSVSLRNLTFRTYNCAPQLAEFNRVAWAKVEAESRRIANTNDQIDGELALVITGVAFAPDSTARIPVRGNLVERSVRVPTYFWRVVYVCGHDRLVDSVHTWVWWQDVSGGYGPADLDGDGRPDPHTVEDIERLAQIRLP